MSGVPVGIRTTSRGVSRALWALDVAGWALIVACGFVVVVGHSTSVEYVLSGTPWLVSAFAGFWILGGVAGLVTRLFRLGIAEVPAIAATLTALAIYELLLGNAIRTGYPLGLMPFVMGVAILSLVARWVVLHDLGRRTPHHPPRPART